MIGYPDGIDAALMCLWYVFGAHDAFEDDFEMCVSLDPLDVLPGQVVSYLVHEGTLLVVDVPHLEIVAQLVEQL